MESKSKTKLKKAFLAAFPKTIPVLAGFMILGMAYGIIMDTKGYNFLWSTLMSALAFCGSMQYIAVTLLTGIFNPFQAFLLSLMVNARHLFYGVSMLEKYNGTGKIKPILMLLLCDETFSIVSSVEPPKDTDSKYFYLFVSVLDYSYWVAGTFLGGVAGKLITFNTKGLDFALTALIVVLFIEQLKDKKSYISGFIGVTAAVLSLSLFGADNLVIPAMVIILAVLLAGRRLICH